MTARSSKHCSLGGATSGNLYRWGLAANGSLAQIECPVIGAADDEVARKASVALLATPGQEGQSRWRSGFRESRHSRVTAAVPVAKPVITELYPTCIRPQRAAVDTSG